MEKFLALNPEFKKQADVLFQIRKRIIFKQIPELDSYLTVFKVPLFRKLIEKDFYSSNTLKETYVKIIKKETNEVEKMIFKMLCRKEVHFTDYKLHFLFYKEFPGFIDLFTSDGSYEMEDLLFKKVYLHSNVNDKIQKKIEGSPYKMQIFYILALHTFLDHNFIKNRLLEIKNDQEAIKNNENISESDFIHCWVLALRCLPSKEFYTLSASELLYSPYLDKINFYRGLQGFCNPEKLSIFMIRACFSNPLSIVKTYIVFLKVIELFNLKYDFKLKLLYCWLRFFIVENQLDLFTDLLENLKKSKKLDSEYEIYVAFEDYFKNKIGFGELNLKIDGFEDCNDISEISLLQLRDQLESETALN